MDRIDFLKQSAAACRHMAQVTHEPLVKAQWLSMALEYDGRVEADRPAAVALPPIVATRAPRRRWFALSAGQA